MATLLGGTATFGQVQFQLGNIGTGTIPRVISTGVFPALTVPVYCAEDGSFSTLLWGNDSIDPGNTIYLLTFRDQSRNEVGQVEFYINGPTFDINTAAPTNVTFPPVLVQVGNINRFQPVLGTPLKAADFSLSGWGTGATITNIEGTDTAYQITITAGASPSISPTITLSYHDGSWVNPPMVTSIMVAGTGTFADISENSSNSFHILTYEGLPAETETYVISALSMGFSISKTAFPSFFPLPAAVGSTVAELDQANLSANFSVTSLWNTGTNSGIYRLSSSLVVTTAGDGSIQGTVAWNNGAAANTRDLDAAALGTLGAEATNVVDFYAGPATTMGFSVAYSGSGLYSVHLRLEYLG